MFRRPHRVSGYAFFPRRLRIPPPQARLRYLIPVIVCALLVFSLLGGSGSGWEDGDDNGAASTKRPYRIQAASFPDESAAALAVRLQRREQVRDAFRHAWAGYREHAWLHDEVLPLSGGKRDPFVGWAATLVDALDALWVMGLREDFEDALGALAGIDFSRPNAERVPVFETTIRYLGGLLGAWDVSGHKYPVLLAKARQLGDLLFEAFNTESGVPVPYYIWQDRGPGKLPGDNGVLVAQIGSLSLEFIRLSQVTGDPKYAEGIQRITDQLHRTQNDTALPGMWPSQANCAGPNLSFSSTDFTLGAFADSTFEYLPKTHLILAPSPSSYQYLQMYRNAYSAFSKHLFFKPSLPGDPDILFPGSLWLETIKPHLDTQVQHLGCFVGGMVGLGSRINDSPEELEIAKRLTDGCVWAYNSTPTGIMPEIFHVDKCSDSGSCTWEGEGNGFSRVDDSSYQLRPEAIESVFVMYRLTADPSWQEKGWKMFESIMKHTKTDIANARLRDVMDANSAKQDSMESFWLSETLKYFYLLYSEPGLISLDEFVLNTEAHPLRRVTI